MPNFNKVIIMGNLTKDPELRYTAGGVAVCNIRLAVNRTYQDRGGNKKEDVCFLTVVAWNKQAEAVSEHIKKGDPLFVEGRLQSRTWETDDKQKKSILEVVAERIQFLSRGKGNTGTGAPEEEFDRASDAAASAGSEEDIPF